MDHGAAFVGIAPRALDPRRRAMIHIRGAVVHGRAHQNAPMIHTWEAMIHVRGSKFRVLPLRRNAPMIHTPDIKTQDLRTICF